MSKSSLDHLFTTVERTPLKRGELRADQHHPLTEDALQYLNRQFSERPLLRDLLTGALASTAIEGNSLADVLIETLRRFGNNEPVGDRYAFGLAWYVRNMIERNPDMGRQMYQTEFSRTEVKPI